ncbi:MAG: hypothetical protein ACXVCS_19550, partial [Bdellovibrionota bacterium]
MMKYERAISGQSLYYRIDAANLNTKGKAAAKTKYAVPLLRNRVSFFRDYSLLLRHGGVSKRTFFDLGNLVRV